MDLKISVILLHLFTTTLPISHHSTNSLHVLAANINGQSLSVDKHNETFQQMLQQRQQIRQRTIITTTTTTITTDNCGEPYCYQVINKTNEIIKSNNPFEFDTIQSSQIENSPHNLNEYQTDNINHLERSSVIFGLLKLAKKENFNHKCFSDLQQIYNGIQHKDVWAMKGK